MEMLALSTSGQPSHSCVEKTTDFPPLGRLVVRHIREAVAVGVIKAITKSDAHRRRNEL